MNILARFGIGTLCLVLTAMDGTAMAETVVVVSARSTVRILSKREVADIFLGRIRRFPNGAAARAVDQPEGSASRDEFYAMFAGKSPAQVKSHWAKIVFTGRGLPPAAISSPTELKQRIAADTSAIGYLDRRLLDATVREIR